MRVRYLALIVLTLFSTSALAHHRGHPRHRHYSYHRHAPAPVQDWANAWGWQPQPVEAGNVAVGLGHGLEHMLRSLNDRRPAAWCGWQMRRLVGSDPGIAYNLARNWAHWGRPGPAGIGAVVVWNHHVGKIVGQQNGEWVIESGNDGHALRTRPRSIAGAIAIRWD